MPKLVWDAVADRRYETGVDHGILFVQNTDGQYGDGVVWNGLTKVGFEPEGAESNPQYADNIKYLDLVSAENFKATIEAFTYPDEFAECDGSLQIVKGLTIDQQVRKSFGLFFRSRIGTATNPNAGFYYHFIYGAKAAPSSREYATVNDSPEAINFSWSISTTPEDVSAALATAAPTAHARIDTTALTPAQLKAVDDFVFGSSSTPAKFPNVAKLKELASTAGGGGLGG